MEIVENRPFEHNFSVSGNDDNLPENLGHFETIDDFQEHFAINTVSEHQKVTAVRHYTDEEILEFREEILRVAEDQLPEAKENFSQKDIEFKQAKEAKEIAGEVVGALQTKISDLAAEIKEGKTEIEVPANRTYRVPYKGKYYFYTWQDNGDCVLVKVKDVPEHEKAEIFNNTDKNNAFFDNLKNGKNKRQTK
ncbi:hypothetical protein AB9J70_06370 [Elizabethkingia anophelis]|uniref:hypothetical protein n=1 Tax=Elizabethkingia anophelis TaxID=1117645 RepID=UPI0035584506